MAGNVFELWPKGIEEAIAVQQKLRGQVELVDDFAALKFIAGVDVGFEDEGETTRAAVAILRWPSLEFVEHAISRGPTVFPYIPGFLSFRETPEVLRALNKLSRKPDLLVVDGQGIAHPRRFGIACHLGVLTQIPSIGAAKSILVGKHSEVPNDRGAWVPLIHKNEVVGAALRTRPGTKPMFISPGHKVSLDTAVELVMGCTTKYRLPETTRWAHKLASVWKELAS